MNRKIKQKIGILFQCFLILFANIACADEEESEQIAKRSSWKAGLFAFSAMLVVVAGIVIISLDGGTKTNTTMCD